MKSSLISLKNLISRNILTKTLLHNLLLSAPDTFFFTFYNSGLFTADEKLFVTKTAREILFDGYDDPLLHMLDDVKALGFKIPGELPSKFGFYFGKNDTWYGNGIGKCHFLPFSAILAICSHLLTIIGQ